MYRQLQGALLQAGKVEFSSFVFSIFLPSCDYFPHFLGITDSDWIFSANGKITDDNDDFQKQLQEMKPGDRLELDVSVGPSGDRRQVVVELGGIGITNKRSDHIEWIRTIRSQVGMPVWTEA